MCWRLCRSAPYAWKKCGPVLPRYDMFAVESVSARSVIRKGAMRSEVLVPFAEEKRQNQLMRCFQFKKKRQTRESHGPKQTWG